MRATLRTHRRVIAALLLATLALVLAGCGGGGNPTNAPAGPEQPAIRQEPAATASPGTTNSSSVHAGGASEDVVRAVTAALEAEGYQVASPSSMRVTYAGDAQHVTVEGGGLSSKSGARLQQIQLELAAGRWRVLNVRGQE